MEKDIADTHERRKAQNRIAQRRRRECDNLEHKRTESADGILLIKGQRLRQDAKLVGTDVSEMTCFKNTDLNLLGSEQDVGLSGMLAPEWNQESILDTESGSMDWILPDTMNLHDFEATHGPNSHSPKAPGDQPLHRRSRLSISDPCHHYSSQNGSSLSATSMNGSPRGAHHTVYKHQNAHALKKNLGELHGQAALHQQTTSRPPTRQFVKEVSYDGAGATRTLADSHNGIPSSSLYRRTCSEAHGHHCRRQSSARTRSLSSTASYLSSSSSESGSQLQDDWESQRSPIASTLTQRSEKLTTDLIRLYELGVYLDIQPKDTELEDLLSEVKRKFAVLDEMVENSNSCPTQQIDDPHGKGTIFGQVTMHKKAIGL